MTNHFADQPQRHHQPHGRSALGRISRFLGLWAVLFVVIILLAAVEGFVLWRAGFRYIPRTAVVQLGISDFSISADGKLAASRIRYQHNSSDGTLEDIVLFDLRGQNTGRLHVGSLRPQSVAISPSTDSVAVACTDGSIYAWSSALDQTRESAMLKSRQFRVVSDDIIGQLVFSPDGRLLAGESDDFTYLWQWPTGEVLIKRLHTGPSRCLSFSADSQRLLSRIDSGEVGVWDVATGQPVQSISTGSEEILGAALAANGQLVAVTLDDNSIRVFSLESGEELWRSRSSLPAVAFSPDSRFVASIRYDNAESRHVMNIHDVQNGQLVCRLDGHRGPIVGLSFASDSTLYSWDSQGDLRAWNVGQQREQWEFSALQWASTGGVF